jgi:DNA-binding LytR/AlgR family response regulator
VILDAETLATLAELVGARLGVSPGVKPAALRASVREAEHLAEDTFEAPAALVYALARNRTAFEAFGPMVVAAAYVQARVSDLRLTATPKAIADLAEAVTASDMRYEDVRAFFASETFPFGGR